MAVTLVLGSVTFQSFEVPPEIGGGGGQALKVHKLLGGDRVIDATGRDEAPLTWSGAFRGANSQARCDALDQIRIQGQPQTLTWADRTYAVVVSEFAWRWQRTYQILYSITCVVVADNSAQLTSSAPSTLDDLVGGDLTSAEAITDPGDLTTTVPTITDPTVAPAVSRLAAAVTAVTSVVGTLQGAALNALAPVITAAQVCNNTIDTSIANVDAAIQTGQGNVAGVVAGSYAPTMAKTFLAQSALITEEAGLWDLRAFTGRIQTNLENATG
jgi:hypothetical protein